MLTCISIVRDFDMHEKYVRSNNTNCVGVSFIAYDNGSNNVVIPVSNNCFVGTIPYFGTPRWQKRFQDVALSLAKKVFMLRHKL